MTDNPYQEAFRSSPGRRAQYEYRLGLDLTLPLLERWGVGLGGLRVLDLGCGCGGLSVALAESGAECWGVDLLAERITYALKLASQHGVTIQFLVGDILEMDGCETPFDLVILSETVEHLGRVSHVETLLRWCRRQLAQSGKVFVSFPPWFSPFAGHQAGWPGIRYIPWYHLMPGMLKRLLVPKQAGAYVDFMKELNRLTLGAFERLVNQAGLNIERRDLYALRPEFKLRYGVPEMRLPAFGEFGLAREVMTTGAYYLLGGS